MKRGISAIDTTVETAKEEAFPFTLLDEILSVHVFPRVEDVYILDALIKSGKRSKRLADTKQAWQAMVDKYFPYLARMFPQRYQNEPKMLFKQEFDVIKYKLDARSKHKNKHILAAMDHDVSVIEQVENEGEKLDLVTILIANGDLALIDDPKIFAFEADSQISTLHMKVSLILQSFRLAAWFGNENVVHRLVERLFKEVEQESLREPRALLFEGIKEALLSGHVELAKKLFEKHQKVNPESLLGYTVRELFSKIFAPTFSVINYQRNCWLSSLEYLCSFKDDNGDPFFTEHSILEALKWTAMDSNNVEILKKLLSLKRASTGTPFSSNALLLKQLLLQAARNNHADVFIYLYETYNKQLNLTQEELNEYIMGSARYPVEDYSIVAYLAELKDESDNYLISTSVLNDCIKEGVYRNKTGMLNYLLHLSREGALLKERTDAAQLLQDWRDGDNPEMVELILQCVISTDADQFNAALIKKSLEIYHENPALMFKLFSKVKNKEGVLLIQDHRLMTQAMLLVDMKHLDNDAVSAFVQDLKEEQFNEIKGTANFYQREDLVKTLDEIRSKKGTEKTQTLIFSMSGANPKQRVTEVTEPLAKRRRTKK